MATADANGSADGKIKLPLHEDIRELMNLARVARALNPNTDVDFDIIGVAGERLALTLWREYGRKFNSAKPTIEDAREFWAVHSLAERRTMCLASPEYADDDLCDELEAAEEEVESFVDCLCDGAVDACDNIQSLTFWFCENWCVLMRPILDSFSESKGIYGDGLHIMSDDDLLAIAALAAAA